MYTVNLYTTVEGEINRFLKDYLEQESTLLEQDYRWEKHYENPTEMADIIGNYIDNNEKYCFAMWISLDPGFQIQVTDHNADDIIRYLFERFPY